MVLYTDNIFPLCQKYVYAKFSLTHKADKKLIEPYFDEAFYKKKYEEDLKKTKLEPIDHFLIHGYKDENWRNHRDPNAWFNVTLYKQRLWPCKGNPFVDYLKQPAQVLSKDATNVNIFVKDDEEVYRAWITAEAFLRTNNHKTKILLNQNNFKTIPICFKIMLKRGLIIDFSAAPNISFYKSPFLKDQKKFNIEVNLELNKVFTKPLAMFYVRDNDGYTYITHNLAGYTNWQDEGKINPLVVNFLSYHDEPLFSAELNNCQFGRNEDDYKAYMKRISAGFDLVFTGVEIGIKKERIVPGYIASDFAEKIDAFNKKYSVSFLLSLGFGSETHFHKNTSENYHMRSVLWSRQNEINVSKAFYVSRRDIEKYSEEYKKRVLPTDSKIWVYQDQFSIAIENCNQHNYFTEKVLECFMTLTIPIYIGCPNIGDYFDTRGILIARDIDDVIKIANSLTPETYAKMLPFALINQKKAQELLKLKDNYIRDFFNENFIDAKSK
ncbi:MAG: hypothetical protein Q8S21_03845 [Candidatus Paracaedibacteraceae bacterium]|nr:hypothetical protein [Candidatus Paracaedibacteraceae bacterium]